MLLTLCKLRHNFSQEDLAMRFGVNQSTTLLLLLFAGTIFCEFLRFGKNRKIKYPQKFLPTYQAPWCTITNCVMIFHFGSGIIFLF